jgi:hypothetical protein
MGFSVHPAHDHLGRKGAIIQRRGDSLRYIIRQKVWKVRQETADK